MSRPPATTFEYLQFHAANTPDRVALIMDDGEYTYGRFADDALRFTKALADLGIERRQIVSIHHPHFYIEWLLTIACENLGAVSVSDDARNWKRADYLYQHVDVGLTYTPADEEPPFQYHWLTDDWVRATLGMDLAIAQKQPVIVPELDDLVRIVRSSGSTGTPKLIPLNKCVYDLRHNEDILDFNTTHESTYLQIGGRFHISGNLMRCNNCLKFGAAVIYKIDPAKALIDHEITHIFGIPASIETIIENIGDKNIKSKNIKILTTAFQRRFRPELINGIIDKECLIISKNLIKN